MWANSFWGLLGFAATLGLAMLLLTPEQEWLWPYLAWATAVCATSSIVVLCAPLRKRVNRDKVQDAFRHPRKWIRKAVEPSQLITGGFIVILIGALIAGIGLWRQSRQPQFTVTQRDIDVLTQPLRNEIDSLKQQLANANKTTIQNIPQTNSNATAGGTLPPKRYTAYEKEQRLRAVDEIYAVIATQLQPTYNEGQALLNEIYQKTSVDEQAEQRLTVYLSKVQAAFDSLKALQNKYSYFADIVQLATTNKFSVVVATHEAGNLVPELQALRSKAPNDMHWFLLRDTTMLGAISQMRDFEKYLNDTTAALQAKRAEIEKAEVYSDK
jgi:hypothetical protein